MRQRGRSLGPNQAPHDQTGFLFLLAESEDRVARRAEHGHDVLGRTVPDAQPDDLRWATQEHTAFVEVGVLRNDNQVFRFGEIPNGPIHGGAKIAFRHVE